MRALFSNILIIAIFAMPFPALANSAAIDTSTCDGYFTITSDNTKVDNANDNLYYDLSNAPSDFWNDDPTAGTIRVTNSAGDTAYSYETENFSDNGSSGTGALFFDSSILSTSADTDWRVYDCSGKTQPADSDTLGAHNVWNNLPYTAVYHFNTASSPLEDRTGNGQDATEDGSGISYQDTSGWGYGIDYSGAYHSVSSNSVPSQFDLTGSGTITAYTKPQNSNRNEIIGAGQNFGDNDGYRIRPNVGSGIDLIYDGTVNTGGTINNDTEYHLAAVYNNADDSLLGYIDASNVVNVTQSHNSYDSSRGVGIANDRGSGVNVNFTGVIYELRVTKQVLSSNYISTEYNNQSSPSTFWTTGTWNTVGGGAAPNFQDIFWFSSIEWLNFV